MGSKRSHAIFSALNYVPPPRVPTWSFFNIPFDKKKSPDSDHTAWALKVLKIIGDRNLKVK